MDFCFYVVLSKEEHGFAVLPSEKSIVWIVHNEIFNEQT